MDRLGHDNTPIHEDESGTTRPIGQQDPAVISPRTDFLIVFVVLALLSLLTVLVL